VSPQPRKTTPRKKPSAPAKPDQPRPSDLFKGVAETLGTLAGLAVFVYVIGGLSVLARLERLELPAEAVIPEIPRERLALLGLAQVLWTLVLGGAIAVLALWLIPERRSGDSWKTWLKRLPGEEKLRWIPTLVLLVVIVLIAPWSVNGLLYMVVLLAGIAWFIARGRERPLVGFLLVLLVAGIVTVLRELEFPARFTRAEVTLTKGSAPLFPEARKDVLSRRLIELEDADAGPIGPAKLRAIRRRDARVIQERSARVIETTADEVLIGFESRKQQQTENETGERLPPALIVIPRDLVARLRYEIHEDPASHSNSVAQTVLGTPDPLPLMCLIPSCEWDTSDVESDEPAWSAPFVF
jgi:hypothetical protein